PTFAAVAIACLSLGIGANATIFSLVDGLILHPHPYPDAEHIGVLRGTNQRLGIQRGFISYPDFLDFRDSATTVSLSAAFTTRSFTIADGSGEPERYPGTAVSHSLFEIIGAPPALGRGFTPDDDRPGAEPV